jgi:hypothetical protein
MAVGRRRPTAIDREIADYVMRLPIGTHEVVVENDDERAFLKSEGGMVIHHGDRRVIFVLEEEVRLGKAS